MTQFDSDSLVAQVQAEALTRFDVSEYHQLVISNSSVPDHFVGVTSLGCSSLMLPNGDLAVGFEDGTIQICNTRTHQLVPMREKHGGPVRALAVTPSGYLVSGADDGAVKLWDGVNGSLVWTFHGHRGPIRALAVMPKPLLTLI